MIRVGNRYLATANRINAIQRARMAELSRRRLEQIQKMRQNAIVTQQNVHRNAIVSNYMRNLHQMINPRNGIYMKNNMQKQSIINQIRYIQTVVNMRRNMQMRNPIMQRMQIPQMQIPQMQFPLFLQQLRQRQYQQQQNQQIQQPIPNMMPIMSIQTQTPTDSIWDTYNNNINNINNRNDNNNILTKNSFMDQILKKVEQQTKIFYNAAACLYIYHSRDLLTKWIVHNKKLGFDHLYIIDSQYSSETREYLSIEINKGYITYESSQQQNGIPITPETSAGIFFQKYQNDTKWLIALEIDEFIVLKKHFSIQSFINEYQNYSGISIIRYLFGSNNYIEHRDNLFESYTKRIDDNILSGHFYYRPLIQTAQVLSLHKYDAGYKTGRFSVDETKTFVSGERPKRIRTDIIQINAYVLRSHDDYMEKIKNMPPAFAKQQENTMYHFNIVNRLCIVEDKSILEHHYPQVKDKKPLNMDATDDIDTYSNADTVDTCISSMSVAQQPIYVVYNQIKVVNRETSEDNYETYEEINADSAEVEEYISPVKSSVQIEEVNEPAPAHVEDIVQEPVAEPEPEEQKQEEEIIIEQEPEENNMSHASPELDEISIISTPLNKKTKNAAKKNKKKNKK